MKFTKSLIATLAVFLLLSFAAFARTKDSGSFNLTSPAKIGTTQLAPGDYQVRWNGTGNNVQMNVLQHDKSVATMQAKLVQSSKPSLYNSVQTDTKTDQIQRIDFSGQKDALILRSR